MTWNNNYNYEFNITSLSHRQRYDITTTSLDIYGVTFLTYWLILAPLNERYLSSGGTGRRRRSLLSVNLTTAAPVSSDNEISNPVICLEKGDVVAFKIYINPADRTLSNYPVYLKDHLYNTNEDFDSGAFRQLQSYIRETNLSMSVFMHVFTDAGTYVFVDSQEYER